MMNFDSDDPLADILSDGSNDSFFEEPKVLAKRASLTKAPDKKTISDLFGLKDEEKLTKVNEDFNSSKINESNWLGLGKPESKSILKNSDLRKDGKRTDSGKLEKKISFEDDDVLSNLELNKDNDTTAITKDFKFAKQSKMGTSEKKEIAKKSIMESLFGLSKSVEKEASSLDDLLTTSFKSKSKEQTGQLSHSQKPEMNLPESKQIYGFTSLDSRERRRSRHPSSAVNDPLLPLSTEKTEIPAEHLFPLKQEITSVDFSSLSHNEEITTEIVFPVNTKELKSKSVPNIIDLPEWLGGGSPVKAIKSDVIVSKTENSKKDIANKVVNEKQEVVKNEEQNINTVSPTHKIQIESKYENSVLKSLVNQQKLSTSHIEYQNTALALQQQESQVLVALQLQKYEEDLSEMYKKQQDLLVKQEQQFNSLIEQQFAKQHIMESNMKLQQERINNHIQLLISQPRISSTVNIEERERLENMKKTFTEENFNVYENIISSLKQRQHEEIFLLEESYKKQIALLEEMLQSHENRLYAELTSLSEKHKETLDRMKIEHNAEIIKYQNKIKEMSELHKEDITSIRNDHNCIIEEIRYEYSNMIANMKNIKESEKSIVENASEYSNKLDNNLLLLNVNAKAVLEIREKIEQDYGVLSMAREESLKAKEEEVRLMRASIEKVREAADNERAQLMSLVRNLETKLVEQSQNAREERWALQQATATLAARSAALEREFTFNKNSLDHEREQLKILRESLLLEREQMMMQITEEKLTLAAEKSRLQTSVKLNHNYDSQKARAEIDAAIEVAKEAAERTDHERENLQRQQCEVESIKRKLLDRERKVVFREKELDAVLQNAEYKIREGDKALTEAKILETKHNEQLKDIQNQLISLTNREKKLAEEKFDISKERLTLHQSIRQSKQCSLCSIENTNLENKYIVEVGEQDTPRIFNVIDPEIIRLRYEISEDHLTINDELRNNITNQL